jgi:hypothetical protein
MEGGTMAIRVMCSCGKAIEVDDRFAWKSGKCKACGSAITAPFLEIDPFTIPDQEGINLLRTIRTGDDKKSGGLSPRRKKTPLTPEEKAMRPPWLVYLGILVIGIMAGLSWGYWLGSRPKDILPLPVSLLVERGVPVAKVPSPAMDDFSPFLRAARLSGQSVNEIRGKCLAVQEDVQGRDNAVDATTLAMVLAEVTEQVRRKTGKPYVIDPTMFLGLCELGLNQGQSIWQTAEKVTEEFSRQP